MTTRYRIERRVPVKALTAAVEPVDTERGQYKSKVAFSGRNGWQTACWNYLETVGELRYFVSWISNCCSQVRLIASEMDDEGKPTGMCADPDVRELANGIAGGQLGKEQLLKRAVECLTISGETYIGILVNNDPLEDDLWLAFSKDEQKKQGREIVVTMPSGEDRKLGPNDSLFRVWRPHPRLAKDADSPVRASMDVLAEIVRATKTIAAASKSRLVGNGIVFLPQEMSLPSAPAPVSANKPAGSPTQTSLKGDPAANELARMLKRVAEKAHEDPDSVAALLPVFATIPGEQISNVLHLDLGKDVAEVNIRTRNDAIARLALGLEVSPERMLGLGSSTNHWSAWQIGDTDVQTHVKPVITTLVHAINEAVFKAKLREMGKDPRKYLLWFDASGLTVDPDNTDRAQDAYDRRTITARAYRDFCKMGELGYDFDTEAGWRQWAADTVAEKPELITTLLPLLIPSVQALDFPMPAITGDGDGDGISNDKDNEPDTEDDDPGDDQGTRGRPKDVASADPIIELMVRRALELAGNKMRTRSDHDRLRSIPSYRVHRVMGPVDAARIPDLVKGWDKTITDGLLPDTPAFRAEVMRIVTKELTAEVIDG